MSTPSIDLSDRTILRLTGSDRLRYLNGQVTNDVSKLNREEAMAACVTTIKGKLDAFVYITELEDAYLIDAEPELRESLFMRLDKYIIADDCELTDVSDDWTLVHILGDGLVTWGAEMRDNVRIGETGKDVWLPAGSPIPDVLTSMASDDIEALRIGNGFPKWGAELTPDTLPAEAGLDAFAIDFHKGCYIGQEVISRIKSVGRVNRTLVRMQINGEAPSAGSPLFDGEKEVGTLTSVSGNRALGFAKRGHNHPGTILGLQETPETEKKNLSTTLEIVDSQPV